MFSRISGTIVAHEGERIVVDVGGLGYEIVLPPCVGEKLRDPLPAPVTLEIHAAFSLDGNSGTFSFFGFTNAIEREFFLALCSVASIGPRTAARAFSLPMAQIAAAIDRGDHAFLLKLPGVGKQKARDIVAKLQGKVTRFMLIQDAPRAPAPPIPDFASEALAVLLQLEYRRAEAESMIERTLAASPQLTDTESLLAEIYRRGAAADV